jgi:hypothetical protein
MSCAPSGIPADPSATPPKRSSSSPVVTPTSGLYPTWPADLTTARSEEHTAAQPATLMEFFPLRRVSPSESTPRRLAAPATFRPQGFTPSRRLAPRSDARPCFMPVTPMGFCPSGIFPHCQVPSARHRGIPLLAFLLTLRSKLRNAWHPLLRNRHHSVCVTSLCRLQGLAPTVNPYRRWTVTSAANGRFPPELSPPLQGLPTPSDHVALTCAAPALFPSFPQTACSGFSPETDLRKPGCAPAVKA